MIRIRAALCSLTVLVLLAPAGMAAQRSHMRAPDGDDALAVPEGMQAVDTPEYTVYSDLPDPLLDEVLQRLEKMVQEYHKRTAFLSDRQDNRKLPLYLYSNHDDYMDQGGRRDSAGFFDGEHLLACIGARPDARAWHVIQHEAFHQYLAGKLGYDVPVWLNEGLAEYFGESMFTGDGFVSGVVPPWRLNRLQESLKNGRMLSVAELTGMPHDRWNSQLTQENYDMAWSLVQFLAHGDGGKYQAGMNRYVQEARSERQATRAFGEIFGDPQRMEDRWREYWLAYTPEQSKQSFAVAAAQAVCGYLARAAIVHQPVRSMTQLQTLVANNELRQPRGDTLPVSLLAEYMQWAPQLGVWDFSGKGGASVALTLEGGVMVKARFALHGGKVEQVEGWIDEGKSPPAGPRWRR